MFVGYGQEDGGIGRIDLAAGERVGNDLNTGGHPESFQLDARGERLFVANGVATVVVSWWEKEVDAKTLSERLAQTTRSVSYLARFSMPLMHEISADEVDLAAIGVERQAILPPPNKAQRIASYGGYWDRTDQRMRP